jgi:aminoglycoside 6'-N-acetyltransferase I
MAICTVRSAQVSDLKALVEMRVLLWPESSAEEQRGEVAVWLAGGMPGMLPATILVAADADGSPIGFLEVGLRSHADGCDATQPMGYVEGWFVREAFRGRGVGAELVRTAEEWARGHGCREMASDAPIDNAGSQKAHQALGFEVVDRCVHYRKPL